MDKVIYRDDTPLGAAPDPPPPPDPPAADKDAVPNPGSREADALGCTCPVLDNAHGRGVYQDADGVWQFWIREGCPLHDPYAA